jgi:hypothetical protein
MRRDYSHPLQLYAHKPYYTAPHMTLPLGLVILGNLWTSHAQDLPVDRLCSLDHDACGISKALAGTGHGLSSSGC